MTIVRFILYIISIFITAYVLPGVYIGSIGTAIVLAVVLGILNFVLKPILIILTLPINILSLGLFTLVINALIILLATRIVPGFSVDGFIWAILFAFILSIVFSFLSKLA